MANDLVRHAHAHHRSDLNLNVRGTPASVSCSSLQVAAGLYTNDSEAIRDLIRREQERQLEALRRALVEGEDSGEPQPFDFEAFKGRMTARYG